MYDARELDRLKRLQEKMRQAARWVGVGICVLACSVLAGWAVGSRFVTHLWMTEASMKPMTALSFLLGGSALALIVHAERGTWRRRLAMAASWVLLGLAVACLLLRAMGFSAEEGTEAGWSVLLLMPSWATAAALMMLAISLCTLPLRAKWAVVADRAATLGVGLVAGIALIAYAMGVADLYGNEPFRTMALHTAVGLLVTSVGICLATPERGVVALLLSNDAGGAVARRLLPAVVGAPVLTGLLVEAGVEAGLWPIRVGVGMVVVLVVVGGVFAVGSTARSVSAADLERQRSERRIRVMLAELDHRVKNTMAAVLSMCEQTAAGSGTIDEFTRTYRGRLQAMARAHDALAATKWQGVPLKTIVTTIVGAYSFVDGRALEISGDETMLPGSAVLPLAVTLNELATNAVKHGAWSNPSAHGNVRVSWRVAGEWLEMDWKERGSPTPVVMPDGGFGVSLIRGMIPHELGGTVDLVAGDGGVECRIRLSLSEAVKKTEAKFSMAG